MESKPGLAEPQDMNFELPQGWRLLQLQGSKMCKPLQWWGEQAGVRGERKARKACSSPWPELGRGQLLPAGCLSFLPTSAISQDISKALGGPWEHLKSAQSLVKSLVHLKPLCIQHPSLGPWKLPLLSLPTSLQHRSKPLFPYRKRAGVSPFSHRHGRS